MVCAVEAKKIQAQRDGKKLTDKNALKMLLKQNSSEREITFFKRVESKLAPLLSRARKQLHTRDKEFPSYIQKVANAWANNS